MAKDESFFDDGEEETPAEEKKEEKKLAPAPKKDGGEADTKPSDDGIDWKAKYEAAEAAKKDERYLGELMGFDDTLEGEKLSDIEVGEEYRKLREMGLTPKKAYAALMAERDEDVPAAVKDTGKGHVTATNFRGTKGAAKMDRETRRIAREIFGDNLTDAELEALYKRVNS